MKNLCTLSDINYLPFGLALFNSLKAYSKEEFTLYYLCLDEKIYNKLMSLNISGIKPFFIHKLIEQNEELKIYKTREYREFVWMLASYFSEYIFRTENIDSITYIDADICFYDDIKMFYDEIGDKSVGIIRHRHIPVNSGSRDGKYNVGLVFFKNDEVGKACSYWWKDAVINRKYPQYSTCYDQKYLEGFLVFFDKNKISIVDDTFAHGAPWHYRLYNWSEFDKNIVLWDNKKQIFLFNHFSRMKIDVKNNIYSFCGNDYLDHTINNSVFQIPQVKKIYDDYFENIKNMVNKYEL
jgi:hypothetical protein